MPGGTQAPPDVTKRNPAYGKGDTFEAVVGPDPRAKSGFEPIPAMPAVDNSAGQYTPLAVEPSSGAGSYTPLSVPQFEGANTGEGKGRIGFKRTESLGEGSRITITHGGVAFGRKTGEGMTSSTSSRGGRSNVSLAGGYYFRRGGGGNS